MFWHGKARGGASAAILVSERPLTQYASSCGSVRFVLLLLCSPCAAIENPASCEVRSVIRFLLVENHRPIEIHQQLCKVYGNNVMSEGGVRQWCIMFKNGRTNAPTKSEVADRPLWLMNWWRKSMKRFMKTAALQLRSSRLSFLKFHEVCCMRLWRKS